jgi:pimeloyl-ACP methyl ester carboxylesterase
MNAPLLVGRGPRHVLCLHGWFGSSKGWGPLVDNLDREAFTYAFLDYRGYGTRKNERGEWSMVEIARDALDVVDGLGWHEFFVVGHSMGGMAMQRILADAPSRVRKLVGISPVPAGGVPFDPPTYAFFESAAESRDARREILDLTTGKRLTKTFLDALVEHSLANSTKEAFAGYLPAWAKTDFVAEIRGKETPVLVIVGEHDAALGPDVMKATFLQHYPNATLEVMANAGHYAMFETPVALATSIERFLR